MAASDNLYSQMVGWARILLPLFALGLLSTLFLFARDKTEPNEVALEEVNRIAREQRVSAPEFAGMTDDGAVVVIAARSARPGSDRQDVVAISDIRMRMDNPDGTNLNVTATEGAIDGRAQTAAFTGLARLETSSGYQMETNGLNVDLQSGLVTSQGLLEIRAPFGDLSAGQVSFRIPSEDEGQQMLFTNGVRLIYIPQDEPE